MKRIRRLILAASLAVGATLGVAAPASAETGVTEVDVCERLTFEDVVTFWYCYSMPVFDVGVKPPVPPECLTCVPSFNLRDTLVKDARLEHLKLRGEGMRLLGKAAVTKDLAERDLLRDLASEEFRAAAEKLDKSELSPHSTGWVDLKKDFTFHEDSAPALTAAAEHTMEGLELMRKALGDPTPQPNIELAMEQFDKAYASLASLYAK